MNIIARALVCFIRDSSQMVLQLQHSVVVRLPCLAAAAGTEADSLIAGEAGVCTEPYMEVSELVDVRA